MEETEGQSSWTTAVFRASKWGATNNTFASSTYTDLNPHIPIQDASNTKWSRTNLVVITTSHIIVVSLRASRFHSYTIKAHIDDLQLIVEAGVQEGKTIVILTVDSGPDWSTSPLVNALFYMWLLKDNRLDVLVATSAAARFSAFNPIEHLWSPLSKTLNGVTLSAVAPGDSKPPCQISGISNEEGSQKKQRSLTKELTNSARRTGWMLPLMAIQFSRGAFPVSQVEMANMMTGMPFRTSFGHHYKIPAKSSDLWLKHMDSMDRRHLFSSSVKIAIVLSVSKIQYKQD